MALPEARFRAATHGFDDDASADDASFGDASYGFEALYSEYRAYVARLVRRYAADPSDAEDLVQEVFLRAYRSWPALDLSRPIRPWLKTIAQRTCIDRWKALNSANRPQIVFGDHGLDPSDDRYDDLADVLHARAIKDTVNEALGALDPKQRRVLLAKELDGIMSPAIADAEGTSAQAMRATLTRARRGFRHRYLALAHERGLAGAVFLPIGGMFRSLRDRIQQAVLRAGLLASTPPEFMAPAAAQAVNAVVAVVVFVAAALPVIGSAAGQQDRSITGEQLTAASIEQVPTRAVPRSWLANGGHGRRLAPVAPADDAPDDGDSSEADAIPHLAAGPGDGVLRARPDHPSPNGEVPDDPRFVTDPNRNVYSISDTRVVSYAFHPSSSEIVFASGHNSTCEAACPYVLLTSMDGGHTWTRLQGEGFDSVQLFLPPDFPNDDRIFGLTPAGQVQVSSDGGQTFTSATNGSANFYGPATMSPGFNSGDPRIVIGTQSGLTEYRDDVHTMSPAPFSVPPGGALQPHYGADGTLFVGGLSRDSDGSFGSAVYRCHGTVCEGVRISEDRVAPRIRANPDDPNVVYAFTERSLFRSADGGASFSRIARPGASSAIRDVAFSQGRVLAASSDGAGGSDRGLWTSTDDGTTWTHVTNDASMQQGVTRIAGSGSRILASLTDFGVICSPDGGATWAATC